MLKKGAGEWIVSLCSRASGVQFPSSQGEDIGFLSWMSVAEGEGFLWRVDFKMYFALLALFS